MKTTNGVLVAAMLLVAGCDSAQEKVRDASCLDEAVLLATTAGSPSRYACTNKLHRMRVQPITVASRDGIGAVVFCECIDPTRTAPVPPASAAKEPLYPLPASAGQGDPE